MPEKISIGDQAFVADGGEEFGAIRDVFPDAVVVWVENAGEFRIPLDAIEDVHAKKVVFKCEALDRRLRKAIGHAHDGEVPGL